MDWSDEEILANYDAYKKQSLPQAPTPSPSITSTAGGWSDEDILANYQAHRQLTQSPTLSGEAEQVAGSYLKGMGQLGGLAANVFASPATLAYYGYRKATGDPIPLSQALLGYGSHVSDRINELVNSQMDREQAQTKAGRIASTVAEFAPGLVFGGGPKAAASIAGSGVAAGLTREATDNPWAELAASLAGGAIAPATRLVGNTGANITRGIGRLFSETAPEQAVADAIRTELGPQGTAETLKALGKYIPGEDELSKLTTAEVTRKPLLAALQGELPRTNDKATELFQDIATRREAARQALMRGNLPEALMNQQPEVVGEALRASLAAERQPLAEEAQRLFGQIDPLGTTAVPLKPVRDTYRAMSEALIEPRGQPLRGDAASAVEELFKPLAQEKAGTLFGPKGEKLTQAARFPEAETFKGMSQLRQRFLDAAAGAEKQSQNQAAAVMKALAASVDDTIADAAEKAVGFSAEQKEIMMQARKTWKALKETYDEGAVGQVLKTNEYGRPSVLASAVPSKLLSSPEAAAQFKRALGKNEEALAPLRAYLVSQMAGKTPTQFRAYLKQSSRLESVLGKEHFANLMRVADSIDTERTVRELFTGPSKGQSLTAQSLKKNTAELLKASAMQSLGIIGHPQLDKAGAGLGAGIGYKVGGWPGGVVGTTLGGWLGKKSVEAQKAFATRVDAALLNLALDPKYAQDLLSKPGRKPLERVWPSFVKEFTGAEATVLLNVAKANLPDDQKKTDAEQPMKQRFEGGPEPQARAEEPRAQAEDPELEKLVNAIIKIESAGNPKAISPKGAKGLMQLMDPTGKEWHAAFGLETPYDPFDAAFNKRAGTAEIKRLMDKYKDPQLALAAYNWGQGNLDRLIGPSKGKKFSDLQDRLPSETREYVRKVSSRLA